MRNDWKECLFFSIDIKTSLWKNFTRFDENPGNIIISKVYRRCDSFSSSTCRKCMLISLDDFFGIHLFILQETNIARLERKINCGQIEEVIVQVIPFELRLIQNLLFRQKMNWCVYVEWHWITSGNHSLLNHQLINGNGRLLKTKTILSFSSSLVIVCHFPLDDIDPILLNPLFIWRCFFRFHFLSFEFSCMSNLCQYNLQSNETDDEPLDPRIQVDEDFHRDLFIDLVW